MPKIGTHSDSNWPKSFGIWLLFDRATSWSSFSDFSNEKITDYDREHIFYIFKILALTIINEGLLIDKMQDEYKNFNLEKKKAIRAQIIEKIIFQQKLKGPDKILNAEKLLRQQMSASRQIMIPPILQYLAGCSMGGLISFARKNFTIEKNILNMMEKFKDERNYIMHNPVSSRHDIDERISQGIILGKEVQELLLMDTKPHHLSR